MRYTRKYAQLGQLGATRGNGPAPETNGSIVLRFVTYGVDGVGIPVIEAVYNNSSFVAPDSTNYGIAPSSLFAVAGSVLPRFYNSMTTSGSTNAYHH